MWPRPPAHPEDCWRSMPTLFHPTTHSAKRKKSTAGGNGGPRGQPTTHSTESDCSRHARPWITSGSPMCRPARVIAGLESVVRAHRGSATQPPHPPASQQNFLAICCRPCSPCGSAPLHVSPIMSLQQWLIDRDANERQGPLRPLLFLSHPRPPPDATDSCAALSCFVFLCLFCSVCLTPTYLLCFDTLLCGHASSCSSITVKRHLRGESSSIFPACEEACLLELHRFAVKSPPRYFTV